MPVQSKLEGVEFLALDALVFEGYLGATPDNPTIAVSLAALELYRTLRLVKPSLSVEGFTKFLCYKYSVSNTYTTQASLKFKLHNIGASDSISTPLPKSRSRHIRYLSHHSRECQAPYACSAWEKHSELAGSSRLPGMQLQGA